MQLPCAAVRSAPPHKAGQIKQRQRGWGRCIIGGNGSGKMCSRSRLRQAFFCWVLRKRPCCCLQAACSLRRKVPFMPPRKCTRAATAAHLCPSPRQRPRRARVQRKTMPMPQRRRPRQQPHRYLQSLAAQSTSSPTQDSPTARVSSSKNTTSKARRTIIFCSAQAVFKTLPISQTKKSSPPPRKTCPFRLN